MLTIRCRSGGGSGSCAFLLLVFLFRSLFLSLRVCFCLEASCYSIILAAFLGISLPLHRAFFAQPPVALDVPWLLPLLFLFVVRQHFPPFGTVGRDKNPVSFSRFFAFSADAHAVTPCGVSLSPRRLAQHPPKRLISGYLHLPNCNLRCSLILMLSFGSFDWRQALPHLVVVSARQLLSHAGAWRKLPLPDTSDDELLCSSSKPANTLACIFFGNNDETITSCFLAVVMTLSC